MAKFERGLRRHRPHQCKGRPAPQAHSLAPQAHSLAPQAQSCTRTHQHLRQRAQRAARLRRQVVHICVCVHVRAVAVLAHACTCRAAAAAAMQLILGGLCGIERSLHVTANTRHEAQCAQRTTSIRVLRPPSHAGRPLKHASCPPLRMSSDARTPPLSTLPDSACQAMYAPLPLSSPPDFESKVAANNVVSSVPFSYASAASSMHGRSQRRPSK
eukprot:363544-Chlamydomonas_euryale.AAC.1